MPLGSRLAFNLPEMLVPIPESVTGSASSQLGTRLSNFLSWFLFPPQEMLLTPLDETEDARLYRAFFHSQHTELGVSVKNFVVWDIVTQRFI